MYWNTENMFSNLLKKATKNIKLTVYSDHQNVNFFAHAIITDTNNLQVVHVVLCFYWVLVEFYLQTDTNAAIWLAVLLIYYQPLHVV